mgnify:CR=1 FL=1
MTADPRLFACDTTVPIGKTRKAIYINFWVPGIPAPKGSTRAFYVPKLKRAVVTAANKRTKPWEQAIRAEAHAAGCVMLGSVGSSAAGVIIRATFLFPRPKGHFGAKGLKPSAPKRLTKKPDLDKLARALLDALIGIGFLDDSQVDELDVRKRYVELDASEEPGVHVEIEAS